MGVELRHVDVHALAGPDEIGEHQADGEGDRRHDLEIDERLDPDAPDLLQIARPRDAVHDDAEDDRRHDHRNELEEGVGEKFQADGESGRGDANRDAKHEPGDDLREEGLPERLARSGSGRDFHDFSGKQEPCRVDSARNACFRPLARRSIPA